MSSQPTLLPTQACNLQRFCLAREPEFFKDTVFLVDRLHYPGHSHCSCAYDMDMFAEYDDLNSQICEQGNALYRSKSVQLSAMRQDTFLFHMRHYEFMRQVRQEFERRVVRLKDSEFDLTAALRLAQ